MLSVRIHSFAYQTQPVLSEIDFDLPTGQHLAVLGESGCGKSTLLHLIYGLLHLEAGSITWHDQPLLGPKYNLVPGEDFIKLVAQEFNVMPYITVGENVATFLPRLDSQKDNQRVNELLRIVDLLEFKDKKVKDLSGGQKQRVALAKALAKQPQLLLLDEPFAHIDSFRKNHLRRQLFGYLKSHGISCITATHDADEALAYSDQMLILNAGKVEAYGTPQSLYTELGSAYQGSFFGEVNSLPSALLDPSQSNKTVYLLPHQLGVTAQKTALEVMVRASYYKGSHYLIAADWEGNEVFFVSSVQLEASKKVFLERLL